MLGLEKFYEKYKLWLWPVFVAAAAVGIVTAVIIPQFLDYLKLREEIVVISDKSAQLAQRAQQMEAIDQVAVKEGLKVVFTVLPGDQDVSEALSSLQELVNRSGLILKSVSYASAKRPSSDKDSFQLNTTVLGPISSVKDFLINLKEGSRVFRVDAIGARFQKDGVIVESDIPISVFYTAAPIASVVALDQPVPQFTPRESQLLSKLSKIVSESLLSTTDETASVPLGKANPFE